jgi:death-on-curing protein
MSARDPAFLRRLLDRLYIELPDEIDFAQPDPASLAGAVRYFTALANYLNVLAVTDIGGRSGPARAPGLVEQVVAAAFQTFSGVDPHPTPFEKAAMLLRGITQGHPFVDGNKRTGFAVASYYLEISGHRWPDTLTTEQVIDLCMRVSAGTIRDVDEIAAELRRLWQAGA